MIIDVEDKVTAQESEYGIESIVNYELATRDSRIGEITLVSCSMLNYRTDNEEMSRIYDDNVSLLRIFQGERLAPSRREAC